MMTSSWPSRLSTSSGVDNAASDVRSQFAHLRALRGRAVRSHRAFSDPANTPSERGASADLMIRGTRRIDAHGRASTTRGGHRRGQPSVVPSPQPEHADRDSTMSGQSQRATMGRAERRRRREATSLTRQLASLAASRQPVRRFDRVSGCARGQRRRSGRSMNGCLTPSSRSRRLAGAREPRRTDPDRSCERSPRRWHHGTGRIRQVDAAGPVGRR